MPDEQTNLLTFANAEAARRELTVIGDTVNVWRMRGESTRAFSHRICLALQESICDREKMLDLVLSLSTTRKPME